MGGYFLKVPTIYPLGMSWANCFRTHNELTMYPLGILPFAPSGYRWGQKGTCVTIRTLARYESKSIRKTHPKRNFVLFRNGRGLTSSWSAEQTPQGAKRTDHVLLFDWNQGCYLRTHWRHMVGRVRLVLQRILSRFLFFDLTLFHG